MNFGLVVLTEAFGAEYLDSGIADPDPSGLLSHSFGAFEASSGPDSYTCAGNQLIFSIQRKP